MSKALITFEGNYEGLAQTKRFGNVLVQIYRPQEVVIALEHLLTAYNQYFSTVADYNRAQFEMFHALGYPAREVAALRPPGDAEPVDTSRPGYLPPVGVGPPPAPRVSRVPLIGRFESDRSGPRGHRTGALRSWRRNGHPSAGVAVSS